MGSAFLYGRYESQSFLGIFRLPHSRSWLHLLGLGGLGRATPPALHKPHSSPSSAIRPHRLPLSPRSGKVASDLRRGQPARGHWDGGRACLLAMRVSRSVLLSVCEAVIRFQDFSQCDRPATRLCTHPHPNPPLHTRRSNVTPPPAAPASPPAEPQRRYTSAGTCSHTQSRGGSHFPPASGADVNEKYASQFIRLHTVAEARLLFLSVRLTSFSLSLPAPHSPNPRHPSPPHTLPLPWMAGQAVSCAGSEEVRTPRCTLIMKGLSRRHSPIPPSHSQTHTHSLPQLPWRWH